MQASSPRIPHKPGWSGDALSKDEICVDLGAEQHKAIAELLQRKRDANLDWHQLRYEDFTHPALDDLLSDFLHQLCTGPGLAVLRGIPVDQYSLEDVEAIYWGIGSHFGDAVSQSAAGDLLGRVTDLTDPKSGKVGRGYQSARREQ